MCMLAPDPSPTDSTSALGAGRSEHTHTHAHKHTERHRDIADHTKAVHRAHAQWVWGPLYYLIICSLSRPPPQLHLVQNASETQNTHLWRALKFSSDFTLFFNMWNIFHDFHYSVAFSRFFTFWQHVYNIYQYVEHVYVFFYLVYVLRVFPLCCTMVTHVSIIRHHF